MQAVIDAINPSKLLTVTGLIDPIEAGITDAHNHLWIAPVAGAKPGASVLDSQRAIIEELSDFQEAGGGMIVDCQPGGCGRDGRVLYALAEASGVKLVACTGFHLQKYYPAGYWLFETSAQAAAEHFINELEQELEETGRPGHPQVRAGFIKIACGKTLEGSPIQLIEAAVASSLQTGAAIEVHTEKGSDAEGIFRAMTNLGLPSDRLVFCHMDKRPDIKLHYQLAQEGVLLEYDTFYRPQYYPEQNLWPLLTGMVEAGFEEQLAVATDMADKAMWSRLGGGPGLTGLLEQIIPRLLSLGLEAETVNKLCGANIATRLARPSERLNLN